MRKPTRTEDRKSPSIVSRRQRLAFIATLVVSSGIHGSQGTVVLAENPSIVSHGTLPPLPVEVSNRPAGIQNNPFFQPVAPAADAAVRLASGSSQSAIRLRPIGAPIDLNTIGEDPVRVRPSSISIDEIPPANVQSNPLIGSAHHENAGLVDTLTLEMPATQSLDGATKSMPVASSIPEFRPPAARSAPAG